MDDVSRSLVDPVGSSISRDLCLELGLRQCAVISGFDVPNSSGECAVREKHGRIRC
jgi:hypothetical protein